MPNGRSGGFPLDFADLKRLLANYGDVDSLARVTDGESRPRPASGAELMALLEGVSRTEVAVEEQDHACGAEAGGNR